MPFGLGFFATAGAGAAAGSFDLLETQVLASSAASITFSSLSSYASTYEHLQIRWVAKSDRSGDQSDFFWQANGETVQSYYAAHWLYGNGSSVQSQSTSNSIYYGLLSNSFPASSKTNQFQVGVTDILNAFDTSKNKTVRSFVGSATSWYEGGGDIRLTSGVFLNTAALTSFTMKDRLANIEIGSRFSLYGIKAA
jgi:hypothetical protein